MFGVVFDTQQFFNKFGDCYYVNGEDLYKVERDILVYEVKKN